MALALALGVLGLFLGIALLAPRLVKPLARVVGLPARRAGGIAGELAEANAQRNPGRTASTAAALMIGITLVTVVAVLGAGMSSATKDAVSKQLHADYVVASDNGLHFDADEGDELASVDGVTAASHVRYDIGARAGRGDRRHRHRPGDDRSLLPVRVDRGLARAARHRRRDRHRRLRRGPRPRGRQPADRAVALGRRGRGRRARRLRPAEGQGSCSTASASRRRRSTTRSRPRRTSTRSSTPATAPHRRSRP